MNDRRASDLISEIELFGKAQCIDHDAAHDALHLDRVIANARRLMGAESTGGTTIDEFVIEAACWLHDVVQLPKGEGPPGESARQSAEVARRFLRTRGIAAHETDAIAHAIEAHSFSGRMHPQTVEAAIVQDADRLDALGAVGIARLWVTGAQLGGVLYHAGDPLGTARELDDRMYGLDHIERKLLRLPGLMRTPAGRVEAERRASVLRSYRDEFLRELARL